MPAAAVIPAPRAYIRVAAVKTYVVGVEGRRGQSLWASPSGTAPYASAVSFGDPAYAGTLWMRYLEQMSALEVGKTFAWIN